MNEIFNFHGQDVRTVTVDNEPWFVANDVANVLGYANQRDALSKHVDDEDKITLTSQNATLENIPNRGLSAINESGLYSLILSSKLPQAKDFKRWVTSEVLPTIRKHGMFATDELLDNPDFAIATLQKLKEEREAKKLLEATIEEQKPKVIFANAVSASHTSILVGEFAKLMRQNGVNLGQNRMFAWLRENGYLINRRGSDKNMPTQKSMELGLFEIKETTINHSDGHISINKTPKITGKGQLYFADKLLNADDNKKLS
ncbi:phage antirepressor KilAC domain-containing protein [Streptococcus lutetiensis]|uniref:phage antirepressor n=1 Tax=Streptococcus lutetiensis TaxID=150055 RepID=UPI001BDA5BF9|nr:phage antirepressor KilAC domain-containing protein [Streptococcus lutetiensis]MBT0905701.1 phage antirepressor KilAC domain-containing protein [Streptococcus lutetiensis]